jgi:hypothetical protein
MPKVTVEWHKECLANRRRTIDSKVREFLALQKEIQRETATTDFLEQQIATAEAQGLTEFDRDRFMLKLHKKR